MTRTKLADRSLPDYSRAEELINMITHIVGGACGIIVFITCMVQSVLDASLVKLFSGMVYGVSFIQLYAISSIYHGLHVSMAKKVMQVLDHTSIYLYIAGTYTPIMAVSLCSVNPFVGWGILAAEWLLAAVAIVFTAIDLKKYGVFSMILYIVMGWLILPALGVLKQVMPFAGILLLFLGGVVYTVGAVFYGIGKQKKFMHSLFHVFVLAGSILQALTVVLYVM